jgi:hypothetical protein
LEPDKFEEQLRVIQKMIQNMESSYDVCIEDLFNLTVKLEGMGQEVSALRGRLIMLQENNEKQEERLCKSTLVL